MFPAIDVRDLNQSMKSSSVSLSPLHGKAEINPLKKNQVSVLFLFAPNCLSVCCVSLMCNPHPVVGNNSIILLERS